MDPFDEALAELVNKRRSSGAFCAQETRDFVTSAQRYPVVLVAGTNGKGSAATLLAHLLSRSEIKVGLFTSPHLFCPTERIKVGGVSISKADFLRHYLQVKLDARAECLFFSTILIIALRYFAEVSVDLAVLEVGIGGRRDVTNYTDPLCGILTGVSWDHTDLLGDSLAKITREKLGITRRDRPLFVGRVVNPEVSQEIEATQKLSGFVPFFWERDFNQSVRLRSFVADPTYSEFLSGHPAQLQANYGTAVAAFDWIRSALDLPTQDSRLVFDNFVEPIARCQITSLAGYPFLLDVAHNCESVAAAVERYSALAGTQSFRPALVSFSADKDIDGMIKLMQTVVYPLCLFDRQDRRSCCHSSREFGQEFKKRGGQCFNDFESAWRYCQSMASGFRGYWFAGGSFGAISEVVGFFGGPQALVPVRD